MIFIGVFSGERVSVTVNTPPTVDAGQNVTITVGNPVTLTGTASDTDGTITVQEWRDQGGTQVSSTDTYTFTPNAEGTQTFTFSATDNDGAEATDTVEVEAHAVNVPPDVEAGSAQSVSTGADFTLTGTASDSDGTIVSTRWLLGGTEIGTGLSVTTSIPTAETRTYTFEATDNDGATSTDTVQVTASSVTQPAGPSFITDQAPVAEGKYIDYSTGTNSTTQRDRILNVGADIAALDAAIDYGFVEEPDANVAAINAAINTVTARPGGGIVRPKAASAMHVDNSASPTLKDNVALDYSRIDSITLSGTAPEAAQAFGVRNAAVLNMTTNANNATGYAFRCQDTDNILVQGIVANNHSRDSIRFSNGCRNGTVRFCTVDSIRDEDGGDTSRNQHGIVSASVGDGITAHPSPSSRFGIVYNTGFAFYSNILVNLDGHAIDSHASNVEAMGNYTNRAGYGWKLPHADNVLAHHNRFGGAITGDPWAMRLFSNNEYKLLADGKPGHVGYAGDKVILAQNVFADTAVRTLVRVEYMHGAVYLLGNSYEPGGTRLHMSGLGDADSRYYWSGQDGTVDRAAFSTNYTSRFIEETDADLIALDPATIVALFNGPRTQTDWDSYVVEPLPAVAAYT